jgi:hypothetical protein
MPLPEIRGFGIDGIDVQFSAFASLDSQGAVR